MCVWGNLFNHLSIFSITSSSLSLSFCYYEYFLNIFSYLYILPNELVAHISDYLFRGYFQKYIARPNGNIGIFLNLSIFVIKGLINLRIRSFEWSNTTQPLWPRLRPGSPIRMHSIPQAQPWVPDLLINLTNENSWCKKGIVRMSPEQCVLSEDRWIEYGS